MKGTRFWETAPRPVDAENVSVESIKIDGIEEAIKYRKPLCWTCHNWFQPHDRSGAEWFQCRSILMIPDSAPNPMFCDGCFESAVQSFNRQATNIGTSNSQQTNLVLAQLG